MHKAFTMVILWQLTYFKLTSNSIEFLNEFFIVKFTSPDVELIKKEILESGGLSIKQISDKCKGCIVDWVEEEWKVTQRLNIVIVDFFENCSIIPSIINYNRS